MLGEICTINPKKSELKDLNNATRVSFVPMSDLGEDVQYLKAIRTKPLLEVYSGYTYFRNNDIILAKVTPCFENGKAGIAKDLNNDIGFGSSEFHVLRPKKNINPKWVYYALKAESFKALAKLSMTGAGGLKRVPTKFISEWQLFVPTLEEQERTISKLDELFEKTNVTISLLRENLQNSKALMGSFLDQEFTRLKQTSKSVKISKIADIKGGKRLPKGEQLKDSKTEYPYIRVTDFNDSGTIEVDKIKFISKEVQSKISRYIITSDDLYISIAGTIGKTGIIPKELDGANLTENAARIVYKDKKTISNMFVYFYTKSDMFKALINEATKQVAQPKLALTRLSEIEIALPSLNEQNLVVEKFIEMKNTLNEIEKEIKIKIENMNALKNSLIDQAFKGQL